MQGNKVVITGLGVVTPLGCKLDAFWESLLRGESGIGPIKAFDVTPYESRIGGEVRDFNPDDFVPKKEQRHMDPFCLYGFAASKLAMADSGLDPARIDLERAGVIIGSGIGGLHVCQKQYKQLLERGPSRCSPFMIPQMIANILSGMVAIEFGFCGPNMAVVTACASATHSLGEALRMMQHGEADVMLAGGGEGTICELGLGGFAAMRALSTRNDEPQKASRPFDAKRDGFVMGEGAGVLVLETLEHARKRGARIYCELAGYGRTCDAYHITAPQDTGKGAARAMRLAMADAGITPDDVQYINAHGTSTGLNDQCETRAIKLALGEPAARKTMISSTKSMTGHLLGAAGGVEAAVCALSIQRGALHPTINYEFPDPECDLDYIPNVARTLPVRACLSNSLGFGGHNATLAFRSM